MRIEERDGEDDEAGGTPPRGLAAVIEERCERKERQRQRRDEREEPDRERPIPEDHRRKRAMRSSRPSARSRGRIESGHATATSPSTILFASTASPTTRVRSAPPR